MINVDAANSIEAVFTDGGFRPVQKVDFGLGEGELVRLSVEPIAANGGVNVLSLAAKVYEGLSADDVDEIERIVNDRQDYFPRRNEEDRSR